MGLTKRSDMNKKSWTSYWRA